MRSTKSPKQGTPSRTHRPVLYRWAAPQPTKHRSSPGLSPGLQRRAPQWHWPLSSLAGLWSRGPTHPETTAGSEQSRSCSPRSAGPYLEAAVHQTSPQPDSPHVAKRKVPLLHTEAIHNHQRSCQPPEPVSVKTVRLCGACPACRRQVLRDVHHGDQVA